MADAGAAEVLEQQDLTPERLAESIRFLATNPTAQSAMRRAAHTRSLSGADDRLADLIEKVAASR
jgi:UDP-N-acetylglucosamine:LPS N-acetylglucosamine transferase